MSIQRLYDQYPRYSTTRGTFPMNPDAGIALFFIVVMIFLLKDAWDDLP